MAVYRYTAANLQGRHKRGQLSAPAPEQLRAALREQELYLIHYSEKAAIRHRRRLSCRALADFSLEMSTLLGAGVTMTRALSILTGRSTLPALRSVGNALLTEIKHGVALSEAMEQQGSTFPAFYVSLIQAGEASGTLDAIFARLAAHYEQEYRLRGNVRAALTYPFLLLGLLVCVMLGLFTLVLPKFFPLFEDGSLPLLTRVVMSLSNGLRDHWLLCLLWVVILAGLFFFLRRLRPVRLYADRLKLQLPWVGALHRTLDTARFARTLATLYASGVSILNALRIARDTLPNLATRAAFDDVIHRVRAGNPLSSALEAAGCLDPKLAQTIAVGEETGRLTEMLQATADSFEYDARKALKKFVTLIEPVMILLMAVLVLLVIGAVMLPIYGMYNNLETRY